MYNFFSIFKNKCWPYIFPFMFINFTMSKYCWVIFEHFICSIGCCAPLSCCGYLYQVACIQKYMYINAYKGPDYIPFQPRFGHTDLYRKTKCLCPDTGCCCCKILMIRGLPLENFTIKISEATQFYPESHKTFCLAWNTSFFNY